MDRLLEISILKKLVNFSIIFKYKFWEDISCDGERNGFFLLISSGRQKAENLNQGNPR